MEDQRENIEEANTIEKVGFLSMRDTEKVLGCVSFIFGAIFLASQ